MEIKNVPRFRIVSVCKTNHFQLLHELLVFQLTKDFKKAPKTLKNRIFLTHIQDVSQTVLQVQCFCFDYKFLILEST